MRKVSRSAFLIGVLLLASCASSPAPKAVADFASALGAVETGLGRLLTTSRGLTRDAALEDANATFVADRRDTTDARAAVPAVPDLATPREAASGRAMEASITVLRDYADDLVRVASGTQLRATQASINGTVASAQSAIAQFGGLAPGQQQQADAASAALGALLNFLIEQRAASELTRIVTEAHPQIETIAGFLKDRVIGDDQHGIARAVRQAYRQMVARQEATLMIIANDRRINAVDRDRAFREAAVRIRAAAATQSIPGATSDMLDKMIVAHRALAHPETAASAIGAFVASVNRLLSLYSDIRGAG